MRALLGRVTASRPVRTWQHYGQRRGNLLAGGIAFTALFSVGASLVVGFTVLGTVLGRDSELRDRVLAAVDEQLPGLLDLPPDGGLVAPEDLFAADVLSWTGVVAFVLALVSGVRWVGAIRQGIRSVFVLPTEDAFVVRQMARDAAVLATLGLAVLASAVLGLVVSTAAEWLLGLVGVEDSPVGAFLLRALGVLVVLAVDTGILLVLFRWLAGVRVPIDALRSGALVGAVGIGVLKLFGGLLLGATGGSNPLLAGSAVLAGLLLWMNIMSRVVLLAAAWAATHRRPEPEPLPASAVGEPAAPRATAAGPRAPLTPSFGQRSADRTTLAAGAVLGAIALTGARAVAGAARTVRDGLRSSD
ncbi:YihY/virulence factor BrkB family protein [Thalassiella azotivora]